MANRYVLSYFVLSSCLVAGQSPKYALKGEEVTLKPAITGHPDGILWKHKGNKVVEFDGQEQQVYKPFENRITLDWISADLHIADLRSEDSGDYEYELEINKKLHRSLYELAVIDKVTKPSISCEMDDGSSSNISGKLVCSAEPRQPQALLKFEWRSHGSVQPGPMFKIPLGDEHNDEEYSCTVSNPLSSETATFTAKDCYPEKSSSVALIASLVTIFVILLLVVLGILLVCKLRPKACFAKDDFENQSPPGKTEGKDKKKAHVDENEHLLNRAPTLPSNQTLRHLDQARCQEKMPEKGHVRRTKQLFERNDLGQINKLQRENNTDEHEKTSSPPSPPPSSLDLNNLGDDDDADQLRELAEKTLPLCDPSDSEKANEPDPAGVSEDLPEDMQSDLGSSIVPEEPEPEKEDDKDEEVQSAPASAETSSFDQPHSTLTESSPNMAPKDTAGEHKEEANSDQVTGETEEKNVRESDSSGEGERNESDDSTEDKQSPTVPEQKGSETTLHAQDLNLAEEETQTSEDKQQGVSETVKAVSEDADKEPVLYSAPSQQPQNPTPSSTFQESTDTAPAKPDRDRNDHDSEESEGKSDEGEAEAVEDEHDVLKEEKPGNESLSEDKEGQKKDEVA